LTIRARIESERALAGRQRTSVSALNGHAVSIIEERPPWDGSPGAWTRHGIARFRYLRSRGQWLLYWMRADMKWHRYEPAPATADLKRLVRVVEDDEYGAFFG